jgi:thiamine-phosphate pyrophosphorylase
MKLIVVTSPHFFVEEDKIITSLFEEGLDLLHINKPNAELIYLERLLSLIPAEFHKQIIIHDYFELKEEYGLKGIHLNSRNPREPDDYKGHVSCTCQSIEEVKVEKKLCDYVFMYPLYKNFQKGESTTIFTPEETRIASTKHIIDDKVIAAGGINADNLLQINDYGFGGAALMADIWDKFDIHMATNTQVVVEHFKKLKALSR